MAIYSIVGPNICQVSVYSIGIYYLDVFTCLCVILFCIILSAVPFMVSHISKTHVHISARTYMNVIPYGKVHIACHAPCSKKLDMVCQAIIEM